ncbi:MAG TPA: hypothetical protein PKL92_04445 [Aquaticitalea sp.]|nr:hypothetical protein [Aquaticitalea sp.]
MKPILFIISCFTISVFSQETVEAKLVRTQAIDLHTIVGIDNFGAVYHVNGIVLHKTSSGKDLVYSNVQLGNITTVGIFNPLKINIFYKIFNTAVILDNRLAEAQKIDFNTVQPYKNVSHIATGYDTTLWVFNADMQQLELFDYKTNKTRVATIPVQSNVLDLVSNYNFCWLLTEKFLYKYNYFGSLVMKIENRGFTKLSESNGNLVLKEDKGLQYLPKDYERPLPISVNGLLISQFFVTAETLYIYDSKKLHQFQLIIK